MDAGFDPYPVFTERSVVPDDDYPLQLIHSKLSMHGNVVTQNNPYLMEIAGENWVDIQRDDAARLGVRDGAKVVVESPKDSITITAKVVEGILPGVVSVRQGHGFGHWAMGSVAKGRGAHSNVLMGRPCRTHLRGQLLQRMQGAGASGLRPAPRGEAAMQYGFYFDHNLCIKCHACEIACKLWNEIEDGTRWREVVSVRTGAFPNVSEIPVSMACMHCGDAPCMHACPVGAITKRADDGIVVVNEETCIGCGFCRLGVPVRRPPNRQQRQDAEVQLLFDAGEGAAPWHAARLRGGVPDQRHPQRPAGRARQRQPRAGCRPAARRRRCPALPGARGRGAVQ